MMRPKSTCDECGRLIPKYRWNQKYCRGQCRIDKHTRDGHRARTALSLAMDWRRTRRKGAISDLSRAVDKWLAEDREREQRARRRQP